MYQKSIQMSYEQAAKIVNVFLDVFQVLYEYELKPLRLSTSIENTTYEVIWDNRCFEITLFDDPDDCGYYSLLPDYNPDTYVLCDIVEKRPNGDKKYQMAFGFDIEKKTFVELFEVLHFNTVGILREYPNLDSKLEAELKDVVIL